MSNPYPIATQFVPVPGAWAINQDVVYSGDLRAYLPTSAASDITKNWVVDRSCHYIFAIALDYKPDPARSISVLGWRIRGNSFEGRVGSWSYQNEIRSEWVDGRRGGSFPQTQPPSLPPPATRHHLLVVCLSSPLLWDTAMGYGRVIDDW